MWCAEGVSAGAEIGAHVDAPGPGSTLAIAHAAVEEEAAAQGAETTLERLIFESLRRCGAPKG